MKIKTFLGGYDKNLSYLVWCESTKIAGIIDASVDPAKIIDYINANDLILEKLLITHTHFDHIKYINNLIINFPNIKVCGHKKPEKKITSNYTGFEEYQTIALGSELITILFTPGHYPDSICFWNKNDNVLFTGDTMFVGRTGRVLSSKSNIEDLYHSVYMKILKMPENVRIYPGHDYGKEMSILLEKNVEVSPLLQADDLEDFKRRMQDYEENR